GRTIAAIPRRRAVVPQEPISGNSWVASAAPNCSEKQEARMNSTGVRGAPEERSEVAGAVVGAEEVVTPLLCPRPLRQVQRMFPTCTVKETFTIIGGPCAEPAPPVPAARTAQAGDDDGGRDRPFDVALGRLPAALAAGAGDEGLPVPAGGQEGGAHRRRGAAGASRRGDARSAGDGGGGARPGAGGGERTAAGGVVPDPDD